MLGGARRPPLVNYLAVACRLFEEVIRIDKRLRPFMQEQEQIYREKLRMAPWEAALRKVYGEPENQSPSAEPLKSGQ